MHPLSLLFHLDILLTTYIDYGIIVPQGDAADVIRNAYENASNKYQDVMRLEASVAELAQMFQDFALIVEQQGELLDQIEYQVILSTLCSLFPTTPHISSYKLAALYPISKL